MKRIDTLDEDFSNFVVGWDGGIRQSLTGSAGGQQDGCKNQVEDSSHHDRPPLVTKEAF
jgi:hypothetical protein